MLYTLDYNAVAVNAFLLHELVLPQLFFSTFKSSGIGILENKTGPGNSVSCSASVSYSTMVCDAASNDLSSAIFVTKTRPLPDITKLEDLKVLRRSPDLFYNVR